MATVDELEHDDDVPQVDGEHVCPECGRTFKYAMHLGLHRKKEHGVQPAEKRKRGRRERAPKRTDTGDSVPGRVSRRKRLVHETLTEILDTSDSIRGRADAAPEDLADTIRRDADRMADAVAWAAEKFAPLGVGIDRLLGHGGPVTFARAFFPTIRQVLRKWREAARVRQLEFEAAQYEQQGGLFVSPSGDVGLEDETGAGGEPQQ